MSVNVPATQWRDPNREVEFTVGSANAIVDTAGEALVDTTGEAVVDTGVTTDYIPATAWAEDDSE